MEIKFKNPINLLENLYLQYKEYSILLLMEMPQLKIPQFKQKDQFDIANNGIGSKKQKNNVKEWKDSGCLPKGQNKVLQKIQQIKNSQNSSQALSDIKFWIFIFGVLSLAQFSIQISLILIQYISSKIGCSNFATLISITFILKIMLFASLKIVSAYKISDFSKKIPKSQLQKHMMIKQVEIIAPTVAKIRNTVQNRACQKTQKLKAVKSFIPNEGGNTQTLKKVKNINNQEYIKQDISFLSALSVSTYMNLIIITKVVQKLFSLTISTLWICTIQNPVKQGFTYITFLLILFYILAVFSLASLICLCLKIKNKTQALKQQVQNKQLVTNQNNQCQVMPNLDIILQQNIETILSIDKFMENYKDEKNSQKKEARSIENVIQDDDIEEKRNSPSDTVPIKQKSESIIDKRCQNHIQHELIRQISENQKKILKKSMLKSTKNQRAKIQISKDGEKQNQIRFQRKKVGINSKKIQYFEYVNISPANSEMLSEEQNKTYQKLIYQKSKMYSQRVRYQQQRIMNENQLLQRKKQENARRSHCKSAKLPALKRQKDKLQSQEPSKFQTYFS